MPGEPRSGTKIDYAADWSEYFGHQPGNGSGDLNCHFDPLWDDSNISFVSADDYLPLSGWRNLAANQSQKRVTVNQALRRLDALVQVTVQSAVRAMPPATTHLPTIYSR